MPAIQGSAPSGGGGGGLSEAEVEALVDAGVLTRQLSDQDLTDLAALGTTAYGRALLELANAGALRTAGGLVIGTDVAAPATVGWRPIASAELGSAAASIDFSSIPATYDSLELRCYLRSDRSGADNDSVRCTFNNDTTDANYNRQFITGLASTVAAGYSSSARILALMPGATAHADHFSAVTIEIPAYASARRKTAMARSVNPQDADTDMQIEMRGLLWKATSAINRVTLTPNTGTNFTAGSKATLYGLMPGPT